MQFVCQSVGLRERISPTVTLSASLGGKSQSLIYLSAGFLQVYCNFFLYRWSYLKRHSQLQNLTLSPGQPKTLPAVTTTENETMITNRPTSWPTCYVSNLSRIALIYVSNYICNVFHLISLNVCRGTGSSQKLTKGKTGQIVGSITTRCSGKWAHTHPPKELFGEDQRPHPGDGGNRA